MAKFNPGREKVEKILDVLGGVISIIALLAYILHMLNANFGLFDTLPVIIPQIIAGIQQYAFIVLLSVVVLETTAKTNMVIRIIFYVLIAAVIIFQFFPATWQQITAYIPVE